MASYPQDLPPVEYKKLWDAYRKYVLRDPSSNPTKRGWLEIEKSFKRTPLRMIHSKLSNESKVNTKKIVREQSEEGDVHIGRTVPVRIKKEDGKYCIYRIEQPSGDETKTLNRSFDTEDEAIRAAKLRGFTLVDAKNKPKDYEIDKQPIKLKTTAEKVEYVTETILRLLTESDSLISTIKDVDLYSWETVQKLAAKMGYNLLSYTKKSVPTGGSPTVDVEKVKFNPDVKVLKVWKDKDGNILVKTTVAYLKFWRGNYGGTKQVESAVGKKKITEAIDPKIEKTIDELGDLKIKLQAAEAKLKSVIDELEEQLGIKAMKKREAEIMKRELWEFLEKMKHDEERIVQTTKYVMEITKFQSEVYTYKHAETLEYALTQVNDDVKFKVLQWLKSTEEISKRVGAVAFQPKESVIREDNWFQKIWSGIKSVLSGYIGKITSRDASLDKNIAVIGQIAADVKRNRN